MHVEASSLLPGVPHRSSTQRQCLHRVQSAESRPQGVCPRRIRCETEHPSTVRLARPRTLTRPHLHRRQVNLRPASPFPSKGRRKMRRQSATRLTWEQRQTGVLEAIVPHTLTSTIIAQTMAEIVAKIDCVTWTSIQPPSRSAQGLWLTSTAAARTISCH